MWCQFETLNYDARNDFKQKGADRSIRFNNGQYFQLIIRINVNVNQCEIEVNVEEKSTSAYNH